MTNQTTTLSDKQRDLICRAHLDNAGWVDDLIEVAGGARIKVLQALERRGLVEQAEEDGLRGYRLTDLAIELVDAEAPISDPVAAPIDAPAKAVEAEAAADTQADVLEAWTPQWQVALAADGIEQLRASDLERVLGEGDLSDEQQLEVAVFIVEQRPDLAEAVNALIDAPAAANDKPAVDEPSALETTAENHVTPEPPTPEQIAARACRDHDGDLEACIEAAGIAGQDRDLLVRELEEAGLATPITGLDHWHLEPLFIRGFRAGTSAGAAAAPRKPRQTGKQAEVIAMLKRPEGASVADIAQATGWQSHTVRGVISGALKRKLGLNVVSEKIDSETGNRRVYRIVEQAAA